MSFRHRSARIEFFLESDPDNTLWADDISIFQTPSIGDSVWLVSKDPLFGLLEGAEYRVTSKHHSYEHHENYSLYFLSVGVERCAP